MMYVKNLPRWERVLRVASAVALGALAWRSAGTPQAWGLGLAAATALLTGFVGFCPACALVGRRLRKE